MSRETFGQRLASARFHARLRQADLAALAKLSVTFLSEMENDHREPGMAILASLGRTLGVSLDWLVYGTPSTDGGTA